MTRHITVVYTINDDDAFADEMARITGNMKSSGGEPWAITAMSLDHEMQRVEYMERIAKNLSGDYDLADWIDHIAGIDGIGNVAFDDIDID